MYDMKPYLKQIDEVIAKGPFTDTWESLQQYKVPDWYLDSKFGIFIHWGIYSVPAFGSEWYSRNMYIQGDADYEHHIKTFGPHKEFGYKDFIPMFKAENFDADRWARIFKDAGAQYVVPVAEHHDGFQMYKSEISHWNAYEMGPKRNVLGELHEAFRRQNIIPGASSHRFEHWFFMSHGLEFDSDIKQPMERGDFYWPSYPEPENTFDSFSTPAPSQEYLEDWLVRTCEIIDRFHPSILYFDWWIHHQAAKPYLKKLAAYYYNRAAEWGRGVVINYKHDAFAFGSAVCDVERGQFADIKHYVWQTDTAMSLSSWCYKEGNDYKEAGEIIRNLVDIVSKNGRLLLNIGPKADGTFSDEETEILAHIGRWMRINGEAIYGTRTYRVFGEGDTVIEEGQFSDGKKRGFTSKDFRFTSGNGNIYATVLNPSENGEYLIKTLGIQDASKKALFAGIILDVDVLGCDEKPEYRQTEEGLFIKTSYRSDDPIVFRIKVD